MGKVRVAVIGFGHLGKWHTEKAFNHDLSELVAIVESYEPNQKVAQEKYPDVKIVSSIEEIISEIDAAIVVTPTSTHFELTKYLLENDKHVFCEKPLCSTPEQAQNLQAIKKENLILQVGHSERCHEIWTTKEVELSRVKSPWILKINRFAPFKGRATDVDVVQDLMIHDIDLMLYTMKKKPVSVSATGFKIRTQNYDHVVAEFEFEDGSKTIITSGRNATHEVREFELVHQGGVLRVDLFANKFQIATDTKFEDDSFVKEEDYQRRDHLLIEQDYFYKSILNNDPIFVDIAAGAIAVDYISKVLSAVESRQKINL
jgi:predicted dehydrogenase